MNKMMCILLLLGAIGAFGLSQQDSFQTIDHSRSGVSVGKERTVVVTKTGKAFYISVAITFAMGFLYFLARLRNEDLRR